MPKMVYSRCRAGNSCLFRCAKLIIYLKLFDSFVSILVSMAYYLSATAHSYHILIPIGIQHGPSNAPELLPTSDSLRRCRYTAVAQVSTCGEKKPGKYWH